MFPRNEQRWKSTFARFVRAYGAIRLAKGLEVHPSAIYHWIRGVNSPFIAHAVIIRRLARKSGVKLTLDEIYSHFFDLRDSESESGVQSRYAAQHASRKGAKSSRISRVNPGVKPTDRPAMSGPVSARRRASRETDSARTHSRVSPANVTLRSQWR